MLESSHQQPLPVKSSPDPLVAELQKFTTSLIAQGYADVTLPDHKLLAFLEGL